MPFAPNAKNFEAVLRTHLRDGEELAAFVGVPRKIIAVTDQRLLLSNFPIFRQPKLKFEAPLSELTELDFRPQGSNVVVSVATTSARHDEKMQAVLGDVPGELRAFIEKVKGLNPNMSGASYFEHGEVEIGSYQVKEGTLRITDRTLYVIGKKPAADGQADIQRKIALTDIHAFDVYQGQMGALYFVVQASDGIVTYKVGAMAAGAGVISRGGVFDAEWAPARIMAAVGAVNPAGGRPSYLEDGETLLCSMRSGGSKMAAIAAKTVLRLTDRRLLLCLPEKDGSLRIDKAIDRNQIQGADVTQWTQHGQTSSWEIKWNLGSQKETTIVSSEFDASIDALRKQLGF
jgi:hypothetical protein